VFALLGFVFAGFVALAAAALTNDERVM